MRMRLVSPSENSTTLPDVEAARFGYVRDGDMYRRDPDVARPARRGASRRAFAFCGYTSTDGGATYRRSER